MNQKLQEQRSLFFVFFSLIFLTSISKAQSNLELTLWNDSPVKAQITKFIEASVDPDSDGFIPLEDRIAVFDNDGTLWAEKPLYNHFFLLLSKVEDLINESPDLLEEEPAFRALYRFTKSQDVNDLQFFANELNEEQYLTIVGQLFGRAFSGMSVEEYSSYVIDYYHTWKHPVLKKSLRDLIYQPMTELIRLLTRNDFKVFIFTADEGPYLKLFSKDLYNVPPECVFGTTTALDYKDGQLFRSGEGEYLNNWENKAKLIYQVTGKRPVVGVGNSNGDFHMLQYVDNQQGPHLSILLHHTDSIREFSYDSHTDKVLPYAQEHDYLIIDMKKHWKRVF